MRSRKKDGGVKVVGVDLQVGRNQTKLWKEVAGKWIPPCFVWIPRARNEMSIINFSTGKSMWDTQHFGNWEGNDTSLLWIYNNQYLAITVRETLRLTTTTWELCVSWMFFILCLSSLLCSSNLFRAIEVSNQKPHVTECSLLRKAASWYISRCVRSRTVLLPLITGGASISGLSPQSSDWCGPLWWTDWGCKYCIVSVLQSHKQLYLTSHLRLFVYMRASSCGLKVKHLEDAQVSTTSFGIVYLFLVNFPVQQPHGTLITWEMWSHLSQKYGLIGCMICSTIP